MSAPGSYASTATAAIPESIANLIPEERLSLLQRFKTERLGKLRPFREFFDKDRFSKPSGMGAIAQRLSHNLTYFQSNYMLIVLFLLLYCLITNFWLLFTIAFLVLALNYIRKMSPDEPLVLGSQVFTQKQLYTGLIFISIPLLWISSAGSTIFWIVGASATLVLGHAAFLEPGIEEGFASPANQV